jgi:phosphatidylinositol phospholipase C delta
MYVRMFLLEYDCLFSVDVFDGPEGVPCLTHKHTLITPITLRDALRAINRYAFISSPYPVILTIEIHVSVPQQAVMASTLKDILGDQLYIRPTGAANRPLPSPNQLKGKFLIRVCLNQLCVCYYLLCLG